MPEPIAVRRSHFGTFNVEDIRKAGKMLGVAAHNHGMAIAASTQGDTDERVETMIFGLVCSTIVAAAENPRWATAWSRILLGFDDAHGHADHGAAVMAQGRALLDAMPAPIIGKE